MELKELYDLMNQNPAFHLATVEGDQPRVRGMLLFRADENGIIFHTANTKDLYQQIGENPKVELCFNSPTMQVRVAGVLEEVHDEALREEIFAHPTRKFLQAWKDLGIDGLLTVFRLSHGTAVTWTMETNFEEKVPMEL